MILIIILVVVLLIVIWCISTVDGFKKKEIRVQEGLSGVEVYMAFLRNGKLNVAVQTGRDFFELGKSEANIDKLRQKFLDELKWFTDIIDTLRVEETLYKKETKA